MIIKPATYNIKTISSVNHSLGLICDYSVVRPNILLYTVAQTMGLRRPLFTRSYTIIKNINNLVRCKMSDKNITMKRLDTPELIEDACALLYKEYIETGSWIFSNDNPSELRIITKNNRKLL